MREGGQQTVKPATSFVVAALLLVSTADQGDWRADGPLRVGGAHVGISLWAPEGHTQSWSGTFGGLSLCVESGRATIVEVAPLGGFPADAFTAWVHTVPAGQSRKTRLGSVLGAPPKFDEEYAAGAADFGVFTEPSGHSVDRPCASDPEDEWDGVEIVVSVATDRDGASLPGVVVVYDVAGRRFREHVPGTMIVCGDTTPPQHCRGLARWR